MSVVVEAASGKPEVPQHAVDASTAVEESLPNLGVKAASRPPAQSDHRPRCGPCMRKETQPQRAVQLAEARLHQGLRHYVITYGAVGSAVEQGALPRRALALLEAGLQGPVKARATRV